MKTDTTNNDQPLTTEELSSLENDAVWNLLEQAPTKEASPMFARNVMREIRLSEEAQPASFWSKLFSSNLTKVLVPSAVVAVCVIAFMQPAAVETITPSGDMADFADLPEIETVSELDLLVDEQLAMENEDIVFMSADDIDVLVNMNM